MSPNPNLSLVQNQILAVLQDNDSPMTMSQLANKIGVTFQTISNHMHLLRAQEYVVETGMTGNARKYTLGDPASNLLQIVWDDQIITIDKLMKDIASGATPVESIKGNKREILHMYAQLYLMCANTIDDPNKPVTIGQMKQFQSLMASRRNATKSLLKTYESMLDNPKNWDPREIVTELMIRPEEMDTTLARSIAGNVLELLEVNNNG